jgi:hypothetical protein
MLMFLYTVTVLFSLFVYVYLHWNDGNDLHLADALSMVFCSAVPVANLLLVVYLLSDHLPDFTSVVLLRGRGAK